MVLMLSPASCNEAICPSGTGRLVLSSFKSAVFFIMSWMSLSIASYDAAMSSGGHGASSSSFPS